MEKTLAYIQSERSARSGGREGVPKGALSQKSLCHPTEGTKESLPRIKQAAILQFYRIYYHPNNAILTVVGDITSGEVKSKLLPRLAKWTMEEIPKVPFISAFAKEQKTVKIDRQISQANIILGHAGVSRENPDYYALTVMNYILGGGGFASRLMEQIRNRGARLFCREFL